MNPDKTLSLCATILGFSGSIFMAIGVLYLTPDIIAEQATNRTWYNPDQLHNIATQKAHFECGIVLVAVAFFLQFINLTVSHERISKILSFLGKDVPLVIILSIILIFGAVIVDPIRKKKHKSDSHKSLAVGLFVDDLKDNKISDGEYEELMGDAKKYLDFKRKPGEPRINYLKRYLGFLGTEIPANIDLSEIEEH